ncbi:unnamed protein product [Protopolystoma xenopodis]|uniref:Uncharacterized protein n=1 Tax=Protopolystoma xenopodis TaxID=117903 RepID=A0A448XME5_9PLAT|nr:unnamed protein product [Protopolystoma xenopodis]
MGDLQADRTQSSLASSNDHMPSPYPDCQSGQIKPLFYSAASVVAESGRSPALPLPELESDAQQGGPTGVEPTLGVCRVRSDSSEEPVSHFYFGIH